MSTTPQTEAQRLADWADDRAFSDAAYCNSEYNAITDELRRLDAENKAMQSKLDADLALITKQADLLLDQKQTIYSFHYAMKDAGWHPGRTDDDLTDIIRQKGKALAEVEAERDQLRAQLALAVAKEREECGWQPIETAPRGSGEDGPRNTRDPEYIKPPTLLLWTQEGPRVGYYDWYYHPGYGRGANPHESPWRCADGGQAYGPTHWMPLPEPPSV